MSNVSLRAGASSTAVPLLHFPSNASSLVDLQRLASLSSRQSSSAQALASLAADADERPATHMSHHESSAAPSPPAMRGSRGSLVMQPLSEAVLSELAAQSTEAPHAALKSVPLSSHAFGRSTRQNRQSEGRTESREAGGLASSMASKGDRKRRKKSRHVDPAMEHVEDHLQILKHVHVKHASPG